jgi:tRNA nucleotidyltransferase (CCA-adding enzyme)
LDKPEGDEEVLYSQLRSFSNKLRKFLDTEGFNCLNSWYTVLDKFWVLFEVEDMSLPETELRLGPPEELDEQSKSFKEACADKGVDPWLVGGRWQAYVQRKFIRLHDALDNWLGKLEGPRYVIEVLPSCKPIDKQCMITDYPGLQDTVKRFITVSLLDLPPWEW